MRKCAGSAKGRFVWFTELESRSLRCRVFCATWFSKRIRAINSGATWASCRSGEWARGKGGKEDIKFSLSRGAGNLSEAVILKQQGHCVRQENGHVARRQGVIGKWQQHQTERNRAKTAVSGHTACLSSIERKPVSGI